MRVNHHLRVPVAKDFVDNNVKKMYIWREDSRGLFTTLSYVHDGVLFAKITVFSRKHYRKKLQLQYMKIAYKV